MTRAARTLAVLGAVAAALVAGSTAMGGSDLQRHLQERLREVMPEAQVTSVRETPLEGLYEVALGPKILYMSENGRFVLSGDLMDLEQRRNLSEERRAQARIAAFQASGVDRMIEFAPNDPEHVLYVFTDVDCAYCRRLHQEVGELNEAGIAVRYLAFPRAGLDSDSYDKTVSVWCADDPQQALTRAKAGKKVESASCNNPVAEHFELGKAMGVQGTPTIVLETGQELGGYLPAQQLIRLVAQNGRAKQG